MAIWIDGRFRAVLPEERVTRTKYAGGFQASLQRSLGFCDLELADVDAYCFAGYGDVRTERADHILASAPDLAPFANRIILAPSHHELHALYAFRHSPFDCALVVVLDNEGMILGEQIDQTSPFNNPMERASYYLGARAGVDLISRDFIGASEVSLGEAFRRFSYYCGFPSHQFAGKTMALAAHGDPRRFGNVELVKTSFGAFEVDLAGTYDRPAESVVDFFDRSGYVIAPPRGPHDSFHQDHLDAAAFVQTQAESFVVQRVRSLLDKTGATSVAFAGGVAYNCKLVGVLERNCGVPVFVPPSPGDQGICVGAVHFALEREGIFDHHRASSYLGGAPGARQNNLDIEDPAVVVHRGLSTTELVQLAAEQLMSEKIVAVVEGQSECGKRALGHRSLLALPTSRTLSELRDLKHREWFRPFGVSILMSHSRELFPDQSPDEFMLRATRLPHPIPEHASMVAHVDGTLRAQLVPDDGLGLLSATLRKLWSEGVPPLVVNTSFNLNGEPLVETAEEGIELFKLHEEIDCLLIPDWSCALVRSGRG